MFDELPNDGSKIKIGRIAFLTISAIPISIFVYSFVGRTAFHSDGTVGLIFAIVMMSLSLAIVPIGIIITIWKAVKQESILFWLCSTIAVALPALYLGGIYLWIFLTQR